MASGTRRINAQFQWLSNNPYLDSNQPNYSNIFIEIFVFNDTYQNSRINKRFQLRIYLVSLTFQKKMMNELQVIFIMIILKSLGKIRVDYYRHLQSSLFPHPVFFHFFLIFPSHFYIISNSVNSSGSGSSFWSFSLTFCV